MLVGLVVLAGAVAAAVLYQRFVHFNAGEVVAGRVYRSAQLSPAALEKAARAHDLKAVVCLMRYEQPMFRGAEADKLGQLGVALRWVPVSNTRLPTRSELLRLIEMVETAPRPVLVHCQTGADRTGLVSALFAMHDEGMGFDAAERKHVTLAHLHTGRIGEEVNDVFDLYRRACAKSGRPTGGWGEFRAWVEEGYPPDPADARIEPAAERLRMSPGQSLALRVKVTNASRVVWPDEPGHPMLLVAHVESANGQRHDYYGVIPLRPRLAPGQGQEVELPIAIPASHPLGVIRPRLDVLQKDKLFFSHAGARIVELPVEVVPPAARAASAPGGRSSND
jgi:protein tyrosine phosphatase (PTP) superfamily phosphohydrolase (DUF442 family)